VRPVLSLSVSSTEVCSVACCCLSTPIGVNLCVQSGGGAWIDPVQYSRVQACDNTHGSDLLAESGPPPIPLQPSTLHPSQYTITLHIIPKKKKVLVVFRATQPARAAPVVAGARSVVTAFQAVLSQVLRPRVSPLRHARVEVPAVPGRVLQPRFLVLFPRGSLPLGSVLENP